MGGLFLVLVSGGVQAAEPLTAERLRALAADQARDAIALYREFLAIPNDAIYPEQIEALNAWMLEAFSARGFDTRPLETGGSPALFAERRSPSAAATVLIYLQADGQPIDPAAWDQPNPYDAVLKNRDAAGNWNKIPWAEIESEIDPDWRIFARSAADSKGPMTQFLVATGLLQTLKPDLGYNLKVLVDTEEELGSPNLTAAIQANRELLAADMLLIFDGPPHVSNRPTVSLGARGIATLTLTTYGPRVAQHSGHYGNFVPNPAFGLAQLLASMKDDEGRVTIPGFYDGVSIDAETRAMLEAVPDDEAEILASMGVARADQVAPSLQEAIQYPSLNIRGMSAAWTGDQARTVIPPVAVAEIDMRLVTESDPEQLIGSVRRHIEDQGYIVLERAPTDAERLEHERIASLTYDVSYGAFRSDPDSRPARMARAGMRHLYGAEPILIRTMGGSIPIAPIIEALDLPAATVPTVNIDNNQHSPNENLRLGNFVEGIAILLAVLLQEP
ncbi:MAG TPA: M20/M25/M40 family metallo-hydrolase [Woeseiaceae bacterium]|jgi:acetylornithine deacetylase/succinyl-diaminopimelate desuccinylase-like protein|nr:M20/M25/M40 family metallo-hydrolase [Woeseiaceae bacterium]